MNFFMPTRTPRDAYRKLKAQHPNAILAFGVGEMLEFIATDAHDMAADKGDANAQYILGVLHEERPVIWPAMLVFIFPGLLHRFENVEGVARDDAMAVFWYRKAAEQGHAAAQFRLGQMFAAGRCVKEDELASVRWYQKAARQGNADAQKALRDRGIAW